MTEPNWKPINTAPHDRKVRVLGDDGNVYNLQFMAPHWWRSAGHEMRIADGDLYNGSDLVKAVQWDAA